MSVYQIFAGGRKHVVEVSDSGAVTIDGSPEQARLSPLRPGIWLLRLGVASHEIHLPRGTTLSTTDIPALLLVDGRSVDIRAQDEMHLLARRFSAPPETEQQQRHIRAPMPGLVARILVRPGDAVEAGAGVLVLEAMKMENELKAPAAGTIKAVLVKERDSVEKNAVLLELH